MNIRVFEIQCTKCNHSWFIKTDTLFHDKIHMHIKESFYDRSFFKRKCSYCGNLINFHCPLVYFFEEQQVLVCFACDASNEKGATCYKTSNIEEFIETIKILDYKCSVEEVISLKKKLTMYENIQFESFENNYYFFNTGDNVIAIKKKN